MMLGVCLDTQLLAPNRGMPVSRARQSQLLDRLFLALQGKFRPMSTAEACTQLMMKTAVEGSCLRGNKSKPKLPLQGL